MTDRYGAALDQLNEQIVARLHKITTATFAACGFGYRRGQHGAEVAWQVRLMAPQRLPALPTAADIADIACAVFDAFGHPHDRDQVHAEAARQWGATHG
jgi:hypothetical protein